MPLEAKNLSFRYERGLPLVLENIDFKIEAGEVLALFAPSGYGKTTLAKLLAGYAPERSCSTARPCRKRAYARCSLSPSTRKRP